MEKALKARGLVRRERWSVDLSSVAALLRTAGDAFPLTTIHLEGSDEDVRHIGRYEEVIGDEL
jgi:hypothetical protein